MSATESTINYRSVPSPTAGDLVGFFFRGI
jgi:hypothetical protein